MKQITTNYNALNLLFKHEINNKKDANKVNSFINFTFEEIRSLRDIKNTNTRKRMISLFYKERLKQIDSVIFENKSSRIKTHIKSTIASICRDARRYCELHKTEPLIDIKPPKYPIEDTLPTYKT